MREPPSGDGNPGACAACDIPRPQVRRRGVKPRRSVVDATVRISSDRDRVAEEWTMRGRQRKGFSLIELVIVVVIIGVLAAIAVPRMSRGAKGAQESALDGNLAVLRNAIELYAAEHGGAFPTLSAFEAQLTQFSDFNGATQATQDATHIYGPYLREVPPVPLGTQQGGSDLAAPGEIPPSAEDATAGVGWLYDESTGQIWANASGYFDR